MINWLILSALMLLHGAPISATSAPVSSIQIERVPATVSRVDFDPHHPPEDMPALRGREAALTQYAFNCSTKLKYELTEKTQTSDGTWHVSARITAMRVKLTLESRLFLPNNANVPLRSHEEGHREINERVYNEAAELAAQQLAEQVMSKTWSGDGPDEDAAGKNATDAAVQDLGHQYLAQVADRASHIGDIYDEITVHGTRPINVARAIKQAFERDAREQSKPSTKSTTRAVTP